MERFDVIVVGGGIAGLSAAYELSRTPMSFVVLEAGPRAGGVVLSEEIDGYTIDGGPDALLVQKPDGIRLCAELGLGSRLVATQRPRLAFIQRGAGCTRFPRHPCWAFPRACGPFCAAGCSPGAARCGWVRSCSFHD